jgi:lipoprotein-anchoring transpeptidase ErfK/SrfK
MFLRSVSAAKVPLAGVVAGLAIAFWVPGGGAFAQGYPPPYPAQQPYPPQAQPYPYPPQYRPQPPAAIPDDDLDDLGPPTTFNFPGTRPPPPPPPTQYGGRPVYPGEADPYAQPGVGGPNRNPQVGYGAPPQYPDDSPRPPLTIRPEGFSALPPDYQPEAGPAKDLPPQFRRTIVDYRTKEPPGTIIIDTPHTYLYLVQGNGKAIRYGVGVGREGFTWAGTERISRVAQWPDWHPPPEMIERQPYLPRFMAGGEGNPLGARALYLGKTEYRIHGTNQPSTIGTFVSSGCIRLTNEDVTDLFNRVQVGTRVVVLPGGSPPQTAQATPAVTGSVPAVEAAPLPPPPVRTR